MNQHIFAVRPNGFASEAFVYFQLKYLKQVFIEIAMDKQTTGLGHVTVKDMKELQIVSPSSPVIEAFNSIIEPMFELVKSNLFENQTLIELRDTLASKLISGEIRLQDAEKAISETV